MNDEQDPVEDIEDSTLATKDTDRARRLAQERSSLQSASLAGQDDTLVKRVALILNHFPDTRDSDIALQLRYWEKFAGWDGRPVSGQDLYGLPKLTSLVRARARIQNQLELFQATVSVKRRRRILEEEERENAVNAPGRSPSLTIFVDESGKTDSNLIIGGIWFGDGADVFALAHLLRSWRASSVFQSELHFKEIDDQNEARYREAFALVFNNAPSASFKALRHPRRGLRDVDRALDSMLYHLIIKGVRHEHDSRRSPLPRSLELWKDQEDPARDGLRLADLKDRVSQAGATVFGGQLICGAFDSVSSVEVDLMQIADLYVGAIARRINTPGATPKIKDRFAEFILNTVGMPDGPESLDADGDMALVASL